YVIFESLRMDLERQGKALLYAQANEVADFVTKDSGVKNSASTDEYEEGTSRPQLASGFELHVYVEELGEYRVNLERYGRLSAKGIDSLSDLRLLVKYLDHAPLPDSFNTDNYLYRHAVMLAQGRQIDSARFYKESASKVGELIEDFYAASFDRRGVKYEHLNDLAETERLLSRPEYTWLSTHVFDEHSPFHGMT